MGQSYYVRVKFPTRFMNQEILNIMNKLYLEKHTLDTFLALHEEKSGVDPTGIISIEEDDNGAGEIEELESYLFDNKIPHDAYCDSSYEHPAIEKFFRPEHTDIHEVNYSHFDDEFIVAQQMIPLLKDIENKTKEQIITELKDIYRRNTSDHILIIEDYISETELGRNMTAMDKINAVLQQLDEGQVNIDEAMKNIKLIKEESTDEK